MGFASIKSAVVVILVSCLVILEEWTSTPSCKHKPHHSQFSVKFKDEDLKVMIVANLLLQGYEEADFFNLYFRDYYMAKFFKKAFVSLNPDMLLVLGDFSARGSELTKSKRLAVVNQFHRMLGQFSSLPFHVVVGDRDVGECNGLDAKSVYWIASNFPGLDTAGCGTFEISNTSFVSLNAVSLLCGNNKLRFSVEKVIEQESVELQSLMDNEGSDERDQAKELSHSFSWRENPMTSGSGPVLLLHFPLDRPAPANCGINNALENPSKLKFELQNGGVYGAGPYGLLHTVPPNATEYIFQALKPRIIFSAHTHEFCDYIHPDGTREVTVPAMTWKARDDPGFVFATFGRNGAVSVSYCSLPRESHVLIAYTSVLIIFILIMLIANSTQFDKF